MVSKARKKNNRLEQRRKDKVKFAEAKVSKDPNCCVITRGSVSMDVKRLSHDFQRIMEPNTMSRLQSTRKNSIKDFVSVSAQLDLSHMIVFTQTNVGMYVKFCRLPHGPTITFKIMNYVRSKDVLSSLKKQYTHNEQFEFSPCIMTNLQPNEGSRQLQVTARMFLDMFPTITPEKASPSKIRRCCLLHYDSEKELFDLRHYSIRVVPIEICKGVKKLLGRKVPDLGKFSDVSEYMTKAGLLSDSEAEDDPNARVTVPHEKSRGVPIKSSIRLSELGPRLSLKIYKVEGGLLSGQVLYHSIVMKTDEEKLILEEKVRKRKNMKEKRRKLQEQNVEAKKKGLEDHKKKCLSGMGIAKGDAMGITKGESEDETDDYKYDASVEADDEDDDAEYFRKEVGEEPDPDIFSRKRKPQENAGPRKKFKNDFREIKKAQNERKMMKGNKSEKDFKDKSFKGSKNKKDFKDKSFNGSKNKKRNFKK